MTELFKRATFAVALLAANAIAVTEISPTFLCERLEALELYAVECFNDFGFLAGSTTSEACAAFEGFGFNF